MIIEKIRISKLAGSGDDYDFFNYEAAADNDLYSLPLLSDNVLIWGHNTVRSVSGRMDDIYCRIIEGSADENLAAALKAESRTDSYSWFEKEKILDFMKKNSIDPEKSEAPGLVQTEGSFIPNTEKFSALCSMLKENVNNNTVDLKTALKLEMLGDTEAAGKIIDITGDYSFSRKRLFINYIVEIKKKGELGREEIISLLDEISASDDPFESAAFKRYPSLMRLENEFSSYLEKYLKGSGIQLKSPPFFEGGSYSVQFSFKSEKQLSRIIEHLEKVRKTSDEIFRLL